MCGIFVFHCRCSGCSLEPCLFSRTLPQGQPCMTLVYVDALIVTAPTCEALDLVFEKVGKEVKLKRARFDF